MKDGQRIDYLSKKEPIDYNGHIITKVTKPDGIVYYTIGEITTNQQWKAEYIADELNRLSQSSDQTKP